MLYFCGIIVEHFYHIHDRKNKKINPRRQDFAAAHTYPIQTDPVNRRSRTTKPGNRLGD